MYNQYGRQLCNVQLLDRIARQLTPRTIPTADAFAIEIHTQTRVNRALVTRRRQLQTQIGESLVRGTLAIAHKALDGALDLAVKQFHDVALFALDKLLPGSLGGTQLHAWNGLQTDKFCVKIKNLCICRCAHSPFAVSTASPRATSPSEWSETRASPVGPCRERSACIGQ